MTELHTRTKYTYDGKGLRVTKASTISGTMTTTVYVFSGSKVIAEYDNGAAVASPSREYIYSGGVMIAKIDSAGAKYYHRDHLSNRVVTDASGNIVAQMGHYPFGEMWYNASNDKLIFTTYERDSESGNDYAMDRTYINRLGRFSSVDPLGGDISNPQSLNRYAYSLNDPINIFDPTGDDGISDYCAAHGDICSHFGGGGGSGGGGMGAADCVYDGVETPCSQVFNEVIPGGSNPLSLLQIAFTPTGSHWELQHCVGGVGCVHGWTEVEYFDYGNVGLLNALEPDPGGGNTSGSNGGNSGGQATARLSPTAQACVAQAQAQIQQQLQTFAQYAGARLFGRIAIGAGFGALSVARWTKYGGPWGMAAGAAIGGTIGAVSVAWQDSRTIQNIQNSFIDKFQACMAKGPAPPAPTP